MLLYKLLGEPLLCKILGESCLPAKPGQNEVWTSGKGMSIKEILTQEYQKSSEVVSFEEEMEEEVQYLFSNFYFRSFLLGCSH